MYIISIIYALASQLMCENSANGTFEMRWHMPLYLSKYTIWLSNASQWVDTMKNIMHGVLVPLNSYSIIVQELYNTY